MGDFKSNENVKKRFIGADTIKGIAILLMVYGHITNIGSMAKVQSDLVEYIYTFHMPLFLLISGYFFQTKRNPADNIKNTFFKIVIPYILFLSIYLLLLSYAGTFGLATSNNIGNLTYMKYFDYVFVQPIGAYWFLHILIIYQIIVSFSMLINKNQINWIFFLIFFLLIFFLKDYLGLHISIENMGFLIVGFLIKRSNVLLPSNLLALILISMILWSYDPAVIKSNFVIQLLLVLSVISTILYFSNKYKNIYLIKILSFVGRNTLIILLLHAFYINIMKLFMNFFIQIDQSGILFSTFSVLIAIGGSILSAYIFDSLKLSNYIFHMKSIYSPFELKHIK